MALIRHIAGVHTATEQRCVRCCDVIHSTARHARAIWPGEKHIKNHFDLPYEEGARDCTPYDPKADGVMGHATCETLIAPAEHLR